MFLEQWNEWGASFESPVSHWLLEGRGRETRDITGFFLSDLIPLQKWESVLAKSGWAALLCFHGTLGRARTTKAERMKKKNKQNKQSQIEAFEVFESFSILLLHNHNIIRIQIQAWDMSVLQI